MMAKLNGHLPSSKLDVQGLPSMLEVEGGQGQGSLSKARRQAEELLRYQGLEGAPGQWEELDMLRDRSMLSKYLFAGGLALIGFSVALFLFYLCSESCQASL